MITAKDIMTTEILTVTEDTPVSVIAKVFVEKRYNGIPVVDRDNRVLGIVTNNDLIDQNKKLHIPTVIALFDAVIYQKSDKQFKKDLKKMTASLVRDVYTPNPITVEPDTPLEEIATIMAEKKVHTLPVIKDGKLVGVVGKIDIIRSMVAEES